MEVTIEPVERLRGSFAAPGDKSVSHRGLILAAMAEGRCEVRGAAPGADVASTKECLRRLGLDVAGGPVPPVLALAGLGWRVAGQGDLDAGNSGTTMRLLAGALAGRPGTYRLSGDASLSARPMERVAVPLRAMGAAVDLAERGRPPMVVRGARLHGIDYPLPVASAQVKGAVLLAALQAAGPTRVREPGPSRDHTERLLAWLGVPIAVEPGSVALPAGEYLPLPGFCLEVPGDFSSAAFFLAAAAVVPGSDVTVAGVGLNHSRTGLLDVLAGMGASVEIDVEHDRPEPIGRVRVWSPAAGSTASGAGWPGGGLAAVEVGGALVARTIDELPLVAVAATQAEGETVIRDAAELRVKESDRIAVLAAGLRALGGAVEETPDGLVIRGPVRLRGGRVQAAGDHRMAMAFAVAGLLASGPVTIAGWESTVISYPGFLEDLAVLAA
jgi:3-phosphoshikimate 1-carboxyvinyltransferase